MPDREAEHGRQDNQKITPYEVLQYLLKEADEYRIKTAPEIVAYLDVDCWINAERHIIARLLRGSRIKVAPSLIPRFRQFFRQFQFFADFVIVLQTASSDNSILYAR